MKKFLTWFIIISVIALGIFIYWKYYFTYSEGYRAGLLQKFSYRGNVFKTYEGEIILSSVESKKDIALASEKFLFSVTNKDVVSKLQKLQGRSIVVHYEEKNGVLWWRGDTKYIVDSVKITF